MPDAAAGASEEPEDSEFEVDVEDDDDVPLAKKKQKSARSPLFMHHQQSRCMHSQTQLLSISFSLLSTSSADVCYLAISKGASAWKFGFSYFPSCLHSVFGPS